MAIKALNRRQNHQVLHRLRGMRAHFPRRGERQDEKGYQRGGIEVGLKKNEVGLVLTGKIGQKEGKKKKTLAKPRDGKVQDQEE